MKKIHYITLVLFSSIILFLYVNSSLWFRMNLGNYYENEHKYDKAIRIYNKILTKNQIKKNIPDKTLSTINFYLGNLYNKLKLRNLAIESYGCVIPFNNFLELSSEYINNDMQRYKLLAIGLLESGNWDVALSLFEKINKISDKSHNMSQYIEVAKVLKKQNAHISDADTYFAIGNEYVNNKLFEEAKYFFTKRILDYGIKPVDVLAYLNKRYSKKPSIVKKIWGDDIYVTLEDFESIDTRFSRWVSNIKGSIVKHAIADQNFFDGSYSEFIHINYGNNYSDDLNKSQISKARAYTVNSAYNSGYLDMGSIYKVGADAKYHSIQSALDIASPGDTILVSEGVYNENIIFKCDNITLRSSGAKEDTIITGSGKSLIDFGASEGIVLDGFTISYSKPTRWNVNKCLVGENSTTDNVPVVIKNCDIEEISNRSMRFAEFKKGCYEFVNCNITLTQLSSNKYSIVGFYLNGVDYISFKGCNITLKNQQELDNVTFGILAEETTHLRIDKSAISILADGGNASSGEICAVRLSNGSSYAYVSDSRLTVKSLGNDTTICLYVNSISFVESYKNIYESNNADGNGSWACVVSSGKINSSKDSIKSGSLDYIVDKDRVIPGAYDFYIKDLDIPLNKSSIKCGIRFFIKSLEPATPNMCFNLSYPENGSSGVYSGSEVDDLKNGWKRYSADNIYEKASKLAAENSWAANDAVIDNIIFDSKGMGGRFFIDEIQLYLSAS